MVLRSHLKRMNSVALTLLYTDHPFMPQGINADNRFLTCKEQRKEINVKNFIAPCFL
jgi:hypothetical protein